MMASGLEAKILLPNVRPYRPHALIEAGSLFFIILTCPLPSMCITRGNRIARMLSYLLSFDVTICIGQEAAISDLSHIKQTYWMFMSFISMFTVDNEAILASGRLANFKRLEDPDTENTRLPRCYGAPTYLANKDLYWKI